MQLLICLWLLAGIILTFRGKYFYGFLTHRDSHGIGTGVKSFSNDLLFVFHSGLHWNRLFNRCL